MNFLISLPIMLSRTIDLKDFGKLYDVLFSLGMMTVVDLLKCNGQYPSSIQVLVILIMIPRHSLSLRIILRWLHDNLSGLGTEVLLQLAIAILNSSFENKGQGKVSFLGISLRILTSTWQWRAVLNVEWSIFYKLSISRHYWLLYLMALIAGNLHLLTQLMSSQGPCFLLAISWILASKNNCLVVLTLLLNFF